MTKAAAMQNFWSQFGLDAYEEYAVPSGDDSPAFPYITYSLVMDSFDSDVSMYANLWYRSTSWLECNRKAQEISDKIGRGGIIIPCDNGKIWIKKGSPYMQNMSDSNDEMIKRKYINVTVEYLTEN